MSAFRRQGANLIDWVRFEQNGLWQALNFTEVNTNGLEINLWFYPLSFLPDFPIKRINVNYTTLYSDKHTDGFASKYVLDYLKHQINVNFDLFFFKRVRQVWQVRYKERVGFSGVFLFDTKILYPVKQVEFFLEGTNLFNQNYSEIGSIPLPGRWFRVGFSVNPTLN